MLLVCCTSSCLRACCCHLVTPLPIALECQALSIKHQAVRGRNRRPNLLGCDLGWCTPAVCAVAACVARLQVMYTSWSFGMCSHQTCSAAAPSVLYYVLYCMADLKVLCSFLAYVHCDDCLTCACHAVTPGWLPKGPMLPLQQGLLFNHFFAS